MVQYPVMLKGLTATSHLPQKSAERSCTQGRPGRNPWLPFWNDAALLKRTQDQRAGQKKADN